MSARNLALAPEAAEDVLARLRAAALTAQTEEEARAVTAEIRAFVQRVRLARWERYPWQRPHLHPPGWVSERAPGICDARCMDLPPAPIPTMGSWLMKGGRGTGKTEAAAHYANDHVNGPACDHRQPGGHRLTIIAPTQTDAVASCITGISGLQQVDPAIAVTTSREGTMARWPNGSVARVVGAHTPDDLERLRAWSNVCLVWVEEAGAMRYLEDVLRLLPFSMRLHEPGAPSFPHRVVTTTPRKRDGYEKVRDSPKTITTAGRTRDAHKLDPSVRAELEAEFGGTTLGLQELDAMDIPDVEGSLWVTDRPDLIDGEPNADQRPGIENDRWPEGSVGWVSHGRPPALIAAAARLGITLPEPPISPPNPRLVVPRVVVAVDPPGGVTEAGITVEAAAQVAGVQHGFTLADLSLKAPPNTWALIALLALYDYGAEGLVIEHTYGGDMVPNTVKTLCALLEVDPPVIYKAKTKVGKRLRAEPIVGLYQQHREHHVGMHPLLQAEQTTWVPDETTESPNRIDAHVHGQTYLLVKGGPGQVSNPARSTMRVPGVPAQWQAGGRPGPGTTPGRR
jgi:phage terminase large subunit-like protein